MKNFIAGFVVAVALMGTGLWIFYKPHSHPTETSAEKKRLKYHCPMHPNFISDKPGDCEICGMKLVPFEEKSSTVPTTPAAASVSPSPAASPEPGISGYAPVVITPEKQQLIGIRTEPAKVIPLEQTVRTVGRVTADETRLHHIHSKFEGYIEHTFVNFVGQFVKKGDPLFSIYSPELLATQKELILALKMRDQSPALEQQMIASGTDLVDSARQRLVLLDVSEGEIQQIEKTRQPLKALQFFSPWSGFVTEKMASHGVKVSPNDALYDIIDLSSVWVIADVYEDSLGLVREGQPAEVSLSFLPGRKWHGRVSYLFPMLDEKTRTAKVRLEFPNPQNLLKPEMYADVEIKGSFGKGLVVPESAVLSTGERNIVFVAKGSNQFVPREVTTGLKMRNLYEIQEGLAAGEQVVVEANFMLDSESRLQAAISTNEHDAHRHQP
ncbi:MAG: efflux RND transporter periplasmic adaptor subunit [Terriglobia bacterium]